MATRQTTWTTSQTLTSAALNNEFNEIFTNITDANIAAGANIDISKTAIGTYSAWATWTPSIATVTIGNGSLTGRYSQVGKIVVLDFLLSVGGTTSFSSGALSITGMPSTPANTGYVVGSCLIADSSTGTRYGGIPFFLNATTISIARDNASSSVSDTFPITLASGDTIRFSIVYEAT